MTARLVIGGMLLGTLVLGGCGQKDAIGTGPNSVPPVSSPPAPGGVGPGGPVSPPPAGNPAGGTVTTPGY